MDPSLQECELPIEPQDTAKHLEERISASVKEIDALFLKQRVFHLLFFGGFFLLTLSFSASLLMHLKPTISACLIGAFFLTVCSYFIIGLYTKLRLPEDLMRIFCSYQEECKKDLVNWPAASIASTFSDILLQLIDGIDVHLQHRYRSPFFHFFHWKTGIALRELLYSASIKQRIQSIWESPASSLFHAHFGKLLVRYADLYSTPEITHFWDDRYYAAMEPKKTALLKRALEEYLIAIKLKPSQGELYYSLSKIYQRLDEIELAIEAYEKYQIHFHDDPEILLELGSLYFENGKILKGLEILEELKSHNEPLAEELWKTAKNYSLKNELFSNPAF